MTVPESLHPLFFSEDAQSSHAGNVLALAHLVHSSTPPTPGLHCSLISCSCADMLSPFRQWVLKALYFLVPFLASLLFPMLFYFLVYSPYETGNTQSWLL